MQLRVYIGVLIVAAALGMRSACAENAPPQPGESTAGHPAASSDAREKAAPKAKSDAPAPPNKPGAEGKSVPPEKAASTPEIDTRIGVPDSKFHRRPLLPDRRTVGITAPSMKAHELRPPAPPADSARNAIGIASPTHLPGRGMAPDHSHSPTLNFPTPPSHPVVAAAPHQIAAPVAHVLAASGAVVSGTGLVHRGSGPGIIGGPANKVSGINGSSFRPKH
jgi:hypothetical protein